MKQILTFIKEKNKENKLYLIYSFLFVFFLISSFVFYKGDGYRNWVNMFVILVLAFVLAPLVNLVVIKISEHKPNERNSGSSYKKYLSFMAFVGILFLLQLPVFLAFYPGIIFYDIGVQIEQYETGLLAANHPLIHTLAMGYLKNLFSDANTGYAVATLIQLFILDACIAYILNYAMQKTRNKVIAVGVAVFLGVNPVCSLLAISSTKDIVFAGMFSVTCINVYRVVKEKLNRIQCLSMILVGIGMLLMRNNAIYAFIPTACLVSLIYRKSSNLKRILLYFICTIVLGVLINSSMIRMLHAYKGSIKEMMSIPAQIDARIYNYIENDDEKELVRKYIPQPEEYNYYIADPIKFQLEFDSVDSACKHFLLDSAILALKHPIIAIDAIWYNTQGYWDMFHSAYQEEHQYVARYEDYRGGASIDSKMPRLMQFYWEHFRLMHFKSWNLLALLVQLGMYSWMLLFVFFRSIKQKNIPLICGNILVVFYMLTLLLGPAAIMRYGLPFIILAPIMLLLSYEDGAIA